MPETNYDYGPVHLLGAAVTMALTIYEIDTGNEAYVWDDPPAQNPFVTPLTDLSPENRYDVRIWPAVTFPPSLTLHEVEVSGRHNTITCFLSRDAIDWKGRGAFVITLYDLRLLVTKTRHHFAYSLMRSVKLLLGRS